MKNILLRKLSYTLALCSLLASFSTNGQNFKLHVLFLGNSFTSSNDLPAITSTIAKSLGDTLITEMWAPPGYSLLSHSTDPTSIHKIGLGLWNYVVLQDQGERPAFPDGVVDTAVYPYAHFLDSVVHKTNSCGRTVFYMTWGYPGGDMMNCPSYPPVCTYNGMDSLVNLRYHEMADDNNGILSPVGVVFRYLMVSAPFINLFQPDGMNPTEAGSYAAALTFNTILFRKSPTLVSYNYTLSPTEALMIRNAVEIAVYSVLPKWYVDKYDPKAGFMSSTVSNVVTFNSSPSTGVINYMWYFGDGDTSTLANPVHAYHSLGTFKAKLIGNNCILKDSATEDIIITSTGINELNKSIELRLYPNPVSNVLHIQTSGGAPLPGVAATIFNLLGEKIMSIDRPGNGTLDVSSLSKGMYIITIRYGEASFTRKFVKE